jgi:CP family cyanate transporter-like MFS transporter
MVLIITGGLIGITLRASMGSVPPLLDDIAADLHLSSAAQGMLTSVTVLFVGLSAPLGQRLGARVGSERAMAVVLTVLTAGFVLRLGAGELWVFLLSSAVCGAGMGGASALLPSLITHHAPRVRGLGVGVYSTGLAAGVAIAAGLALPSEDLLGDWRTALAVWAVPTSVVTLLWLLLVSALRAAGDTEPDGPPDHRLPWRSATAWWVTGYTAAWMVIGFSGLAWVMPVYVSLGIPESRAAGYFVVFQLVQLLSMLALPALTDITSDRRPLLALTLTCALVGVFLLIVAPVQLAIPAVSLFGLGAGGGLTMSLVLIADVTTTQADGARLNAMSMLIAYPLGALAPLMMGALHDVTGTFATGYSVILAVTALALCCVRAFRPSRTLARMPVPSLGVSGTP